MATEALTVQQITRAGLAPTFTNPTATDGWTFSGNTGNHFLRVKNTNGSSRTVTPTPTGKSKSGLSLTAEPVTIPDTTGDVLIGPFDPSDFGATVTIACSATAGLSAAAIKL
jgi:hypothetical protein